MLQMEFTISSDGLHLINQECTEICFVTFKTYTGGATLTPLQWREGGGGEEGEEGEEEGVEGEGAGQTFTGLDESHRNKTKHATS